MSLVKEAQHHGAILRTGEELAFDTHEIVDAVLGTGWRLGNIPGLREIGCRRVCPRSPEFWCDRRSEAGDHTCSLSSIGPPLVSGFETFIGQELAVMASDFPESILAKLKIKSGSEPRGLLYDLSIELFAIARRFF
jgi:hypothetical protein